MKANNPHLISLMRHLKFNQEDLEQNRQGYITPRQIEKWGKPPVSPLVQAILLGHFFGVVALLALIAFASQSPVMIVVILAIIAVLAVPFNVLADRGRATIQMDIQKGKVRFICGTLRKSQTRLALQSTYAIEIEQLRFTVDQTLFRMFSDETRYCVYYLPESRTIISAET